jgi:hypothetical protein
VKKPMFHSFARVSQQLPADAVFAQYGGHATMMERSSILRSPPTSEWPMERKVAAAFVLGARRTVGHGLPALRGGQRALLTAARSASPRTCALSSWT